MPHVFFKNRLFQMLRKVARRMAPKSGHYRAKRFNFLKQFKILSMTLYVYSYFNFQA